MITRQVAGRVYNYSYCIGRVTQSGPGFSLPTDFVLGSEESFYVVSRSHEVAQGSGVNKCTFNHDLIWEDRGPGFAKGQAVWPSSVDADRAENVYVSDEYAGKIFILGKDGDYLGDWGTKGSGDGELNGPSGLAFDREEHLYIVDSLNHRVQVFTKDGRSLAKWGSQGTDEGQFNIPWGIAIDHQGDVYVADWRNGRVQKFSAEGQYLSTIGGPEAGEGALQRPTGVAIDTDGDVYVTDQATNRLNIYDADAAFITAFIGDADRLSLWSAETVDANPDYMKARRRVDLTPEQRFRRPVAVNVDDQGRIMVLETQCARIQIYVKERDFVDAQFNL